MSAPVLWITYSIDGRPHSSSEVIDLATRDTYWLPEALGEYYDRVDFGIQVKSSRAVNVSASDGALSRHGTDRYSLTVRRQHGGMSGTRRVALVVRADDLSYPVEITLPIHPDHLELGQFHAMLDDISHWVFIALDSPVGLDIGYSDRFHAALRSQLAVLQLIEQRVADVEDLLQRIATSPAVRIRKEYYQVPAGICREDPLSLRWTSRNPDDSRTLAYRNTVSYDVYENRFLVFFLGEMGRRLSFLQHIIKRTIKEKDSAIRREKAYDNLHAVSSLEKQKQEAAELLEKCQALASRLALLRNLDFLKDVTFVPSQFHLTFSLALTQDFNYSRIFSLYRELGRDEEIQRLDRIRNFTDRLTTLGVKAGRTIYEYWTFFAILSELLALHFRCKDEHELLEMIVGDVLDPHLASGNLVTLVGDENIYGDMQVRLYYDRAYKDRNGHEQARPDITMEVVRNRTSVRFLFDAKYKTYTDPTGQNSKNWFWREDFRQVSRKYQDPSSRGAVAESRGAFLLHVNTQDKWFENYGAFVQGSDGAPWQANAHRFGFIPLVPGNLMSLRTLLGMIFLIKLDTGLDICWTCGSTDVRKEAYHSARLDSERTNKRVCQKCGHEWWINKCSRDCKFPLFKGNFSFQITHQEVDPMTQCNGYVCPGCGKCVCGQQVVSLRRT